MPNTVTLTVRKGSLPVPEYRFEDRECIFLGRMEDCGLRIPDNKSHCHVSRYHCQIDIQPPRAVICDFASLHGTFINNELIGKRSAEETPEEGRRRRSYAERVLQDGDVIRLADQVELEVRIASESPAPTVAPTAAAEPGRLDPAEIQKAYHTRRAALLAKDPVREALEPGYELVQELGEGGTGKVFLARRCSDGKPVAVKVMVPESVFDPYLRDAFEREVTIVRQLEHPNIVRILDTIRHDDLVLLVMEYCNGRDVFTAMKTRGRLFTPREAVSIAIQVLDALVYAHAAPVRIPLPDGSERTAHGVVHRDVKPMNILLDAASPVARLADFGLAKAFDLAGMSGLSRSGIGRGFAGGTFPFMSRVQCVKFKYAQPDVDVWATAASLYYMLTGKTPRDFPENEDDYHVILHNPPVPIQERRADLPRELAGIIDAALVDKPEILVKTARQLRDELARLEL